MKYLLFFIIPNFVLGFNNCAEKTINHRILATQDTVACKYYNDSLYQIDIYTKFSKSPEFYGGKRELFRFVRDKLVVSEDEFGENNGKVVAQFIVDRNGLIMNVSIRDKAREEYTSLDKKVIQIISSMPKWKPGKCKGESVATFNTFPLVF